ncbi:MAG: ATP-dependent DNA helicase RecG [Lachnospiraceae bacterium]|nr:ATP-dependent DNA helicase RecG [Lachnospiraceae bacterium]
MKLTDSLTSLKGVGPKTAANYAKLGILTIRDLLEYYPREYVIYEKTSPIARPAFNAKVFVYARVLEAPSIFKARNGLTVVNISCEDEAGDRFTVSYYNQPWIRQQVKTGQAYVFVGRKGYKNGRLVIESPERFTFEEYKTIRGSMVPVYPLTKGISRNAIIALIKSVFAEGFDAMGSDISPEFEKKNDMSAYDEAIRAIHFPKSDKDYLRARRRLVFEEFYVFLKKLYALKDKTEVIKSEARIVPSGVVNKVVSELPYELTRAQKKAVKEVLEEMYSGRVLNRLIQGDVGSGKTIVAFLALLEVAANGYQGALMAPTEVLATQHYNALMKLLDGLGLQINVTLLTGSMKASQKREVYDNIKNHRVDIIIGTHALFQDGVSYDNIALVVTDEQHRFGVRQRDALAGKGNTCHVLSMSATPIPRSLAGILYADMDVSILDEKPANRKPIRSCVVGPDYHEKAYRFIEEQLRQGHQAYVICTLVEESEEMSGENVTNYTKTLQNFFKNRRVEMLHGRMKPADKDAVMRRFSEGEVDILVSTTVVEVGVNVPNATVMMIEDAQKFGLATLHQLRGRIGRGDDSSYCIFIDSSGSETENQRLSVLNHSEDGFYIASEDLKMRGPGDLFGVAQSGELNFKLADIYRDESLLILASDKAKMSCII